MRRPPYRRSGAGGVVSRRGAPSFAILRRRARQNRTLNAATGPAADLTAVDSLPRATRTRLRFLEFLYDVVSDSARTARLALLIVVVAVAAGAVFRFVRLEEQWVWVLLSALGISGVAKFRQRHDSKVDDTER